MLSLASSFLFSLCLPFSLLASLTFFSLNLALFSFFSGSGRNQRREKTWFLLFCLLIASISQQKPCLALMSCTILLFLSIIAIPCLQSPCLLLTFFFLSFFLVSFGRPLPSPRSQLTHMLKSLVLPSLYIVHQCLYLSQRSTMSCSLL